MVEGIVTVQVLWNGSNINYINSRINSHVLRAVIHVCKEEDADGHIICLGEERNAHNIWFEGTRLEIT